MSGLLLWAKVEGLALVKRIAGPALGLGRRLNAQRRAAAGTHLPPEDRVGVILEDTIGALTGRSTQPGWWLSVLARIQQIGINPDPLFQGESLLPWLDDRLVRKDLRRLAQRRITGPSGQAGDQACYERLARRYETLVGDIGASASGKVDQILAVLVAGLDADISSSATGRALSVQMQAATEDTHHKLDHILMQLAASGYAADIAALKSWTARSLSAAPRFLQLLKSLSNTRLERDVWPTVRDAAEQASFLIVGDPGSGKSGLSYALGLDRQQAGKDLVFLPVDTLKADSQVTLRAELGITHDLADVLAHWQGTDDALLIVDALDAARNGETRAVLSSVIDEVLRAGGGRWRVIASVRK